MKHPNYVCLFVCTVLTSHAAIVTDPALGQETGSTDFEVSVEGRKVDVHTARVLDPPFAGKEWDFGGPYSFANFDMDGPVAVRIISRRSLGATVVRPASPDVRWKVIDEHTLTLTFERPRKVSIEPDGKRGPLLLFANSVETDLPKAGATNVFFFGPGMHKPGLVTAVDNGTVYLADGAVVKGAIVARGTNIQIRGRGILDGSDYEWRKGPHPFTIGIYGTNITVRDITIRGSSHWTIVPRGSRHVTIRNVKLCGSRVQNDDGINPCNSQDVLITDCFIRSDDDCVALKGIDLERPDNNVERITVENCVLWCDRARIFLLGHESRAAAMREVTLRNLDIIHFTMTPFLFEPGEDMRLENIRVEDVRIHGEGQKEIIRLKPVVNQYMRKKVPGFIRDVRFKNVAVVGQPGAYRVQLAGADAEHDVRSVTFENVSILGTNLTRLSPALTVGAHVSDVRFQSLPGARTSAAARPIPPAYGPHIGLTSAAFAEAKSFRAADRIVGTYYFYWYDAATKEHIVDSDGTDALTTHPPTLEDFSYRSVTWHKRQLHDMIAAGIDVVLPVFWGAPSEQDSSAHLHWSYVGIPRLVQAREELLREGARPPRIGLFYDTSTLRHNAWREHVDLTTERGQRWFYATVRDFFSMVPPKHWAMIDDKPIVLLYSASFAQRHDQGCIDFTKTAFAKDFGGHVPWIAREVSWRVNADNTVAWGGALGLKNPGVASLGPGYDHSAVPGRDRLVVDREGGAFYVRQWEKFLRRPSNFVMIETWNEWHEGTDVAESREYGRRYIELTRQYADLFRQGWRPAVAKGKFTDANSVAITLAASNLEAGLKLIENEDGVTQAGAFGNRTARGLGSGTARGRYIYLAVDESFKNADPADFVLQVNYFDAAPGLLAVEFDGSDESAPFNGAYTRSPDRLRLTGDREWKTATFHLRRARFLNGQNRGADLRLAVEAPAFAVRQVELRK